jgi:hypothetical protein
MMMLDNSRGTDDDSGDDESIELGKNDLFGLVLNDHMPTTTISLGS